ncbi:hypothetical protein [Sphingobium lactosutens]|uniref:Uncharacterized protein n=1 Tax=Sphingobium lactosutens DS20 TaxID=1331060 RepID=T0H4H7_9SPHN|nr:hypothetical protein [Sphingobium lactosutens]EQB11261.1 hypothetical protein RLDS_22935 [Sphingobium lactosutens DS20]
MRIDIRKGYIDQRKAAYGTTEEQLDFMYHNGFEAWLERQRAIKDDIPKE